MTTVGIVGGGILGLAVGREIIRRRPGAKVVVFEKEGRVAAHQTGNNSGVVHAGIYYKPGSLKAELCTRGRDLLRDYCAEHHLPYNECGKLVVAVSTVELDRLDALEKTARDNGVPGLRRLDGAEIHEVEPHAAGLAALHSPRTAITDYAAIARCMAEEITAAGGEVLLSTPVTGVTREPLTVHSGPQAFAIDRLVLCAGLQADRVGKHVGDDPSPRIVPFRGQYMTVRQDKQDLVRGMVYPVPDPRYPFLGVHFTRRVSGELEVGPNAVLALRNIGRTLSWPGFWRMARTHWRTGVRELRGALSTKAYLRAAQRYVPEIGAGDVIRAGAGIRAQAVERDGTLVDDFRINSTGGVTSVRNAPSPAATSSLAIAALIVDRI